MVNKNSILRNKEFITCFIQFIIDLTENKNFYYNVIKFYAVSNTNTISLYPYVWFNIFEQFYFSLKSSQIILLKKKNHPRFLIEAYFSFFLFFAQRRDNPFPIKLIGIKMKQVQQFLN